MPRPTPRNPREYTHIPYIFRNESLSRSYFFPLIVWVNRHSNFCMGSRPRTHLCCSHRTTRGSVSSYNIAGLISEVSEEVATQIAKNRQQPHSHLRPQPRGTPASIRIYLIFPEISHWPTFLSLLVWVYSHSNLCSGLQNTHHFCNRVHFGRSRSSKVDDFGTNRKCVYDFLFVPHCDYGPILHRF